jgi:hypothetical protein
MPTKYMACPFKHVGQPEKIRNTAKSKHTENEANKQTPKTVFISGTPFC